MVLHADFTDTPIVDLHLDDHLRVIVTRHLNVSVESLDTCAALAGLIVGVFSIRQQDPRPFHAWALSFTGSEYFILGRRTNVSTRRVKPKPLVFFYNSTIVWYALAATLFDVVGFHRFETRWAFFRCAVLSQVRTFLYVILVTEANFLAGYFFNNLADRVLPSVNDTTTAVF